MSDLVSNELDAQAWPFVEARRIQSRFKGKPEPKECVVFQTGYGPSGLPHIGTFGEVVRTNMVRKAYEALSGVETKLICFSDDLDGFRKVPLNVPKRNELIEDLDLPLSRVRDPFGKYRSFAEHNNSMLCEFLDRFKVDYKFISATEQYKSGYFDEYLLRALERFEQLMEIILPSLGKITRDRESTYSLFLPISPKSGKVLQVPTLERNVSNGTIVYKEPDGEKVELPVTGGHVKMQWRPDWAMRWAALGVDYEMYGKDLIPSADLAKKLCRVLGKPPPIDMFYELFLDENGQKISKSKGSENFSMEQWIDYSSAESLCLFMYQKPKTAKRLHIGILPKTFDDYHGYLNEFVKQDQLARLNNPVWHIHEGNPPLSGMFVTYSLLLNLVSATGSTNTDILWGFVKNYNAEANEYDNPDLARAICGAIKYYEECILPKRNFRKPVDREFTALSELAEILRNWTDPETAEDFQRAVYTIGRKYEFNPMREWFMCIYEILFGASQGPRFGSFIGLFGAKQTAKLIEEKLSFSE